MFSIDSYNKTNVVESFFLKVILDFARRQGAEQAWAETITVLGHMWIPGCRDVND